MHNPARFGQAQHRAALVIAVRIAMHATGFHQPGERAADRHFVHRGALGHFSRRKPVEPSQHRHYAPLGHAQVVTALVVVGDRLAHRVRKNRQPIGQETLQFQWGVFGSGGRGPSDVNDDFESTITYSTRRSGRETTSWLFCLGG